MYSDNLAFRKNADNLFDRIDSSPSQDITLDFSKVSTVSRSFAHQYIQRKKKSNKNITEVGVKEDVKKMMEIAKANKVRHNTINFNKMKVISL
jgi:anti-anti-sigma regulatory factor